MPAISSQRKNETLAVVEYILQNTQNLVILRFCFPGDSHEI